ncbi:hypothetical protein BC937DRAFT_93312 [Endogone sp. FLAS-F59071]|nr:hypothetical protein BC937DRAFT_93312 [Endogone sp. FLAS-F59071]|eukprot:RUS23368.1 hypothetical protein BC937DRAFT_93312 [Endogone sp. FLAS-F59071]
MSLLLLLPASQPQLPLQRAHILHKPSTTFWTDFLTRFMSACRSQPTHQYLLSSNHQPTDSACLISSFLDPEGSLGFTVEYYKWYKIVSDTKTGAMYALVCCNQPFSQPGFSGVFNVPVQNIVSMDVKSIAFIELLESWQLIKAVGAPNNVTSNCVYNNLRAAENLQPFDLSLPNATGPWDIVFTQTPYNDRKVVLVNITDDYAPLDVRTVLKFIDVPEFVLVLQCISQINPLCTLVQKAKWIYFYSTFLNQEGLALNIYQNIQNQYKCHKSNFAHVGQKLLAWVNYDPAASTWHINTDKYHNTLLSDAG